MIVVDASAVVDMLLRTPAGERVERRMESDAGPFHTAHLIDPEVVGALSRLVRAGKIRPEIGTRCIGEFARLPLERHAHEPLVARAWELRENVRSYDAMYVVIAELAGCPLVTTDAALARSSGHRATIESLAGLA